MHVEECAHACMYAFMYMYDVLVEIWGRGNERRA